MSLGVLLALLVRGASADVLSILKRQETLLLSLLMVSLFSLLGGFLPHAYWGNGATYIFLPTYSVFVFVVGLLVPSAIGTHEMPRGWIAVALAVLVGTVVVDTFLPGFFSSLSSRAAGLAENPNAAAIRMVLLLSVLLRYERVRGFDIVALCLVGLAVLMTFSRGGLILFFALAGTYAFYVYRWSLVQTVRIFGLVAIAAGILTFLFVHYFSDLPLAQAVNPARLAFFTGGGGLSVTGDVRVRLIRQYLRLINEAPVFGKGTGYSFGPTGGEIPLGPHNMYLRQWIDNGLPGLLAYVAVLGSAGLTSARKGCRPGVALVVVAALAGLFSHNLLEDRTFLLLLGLLASVSVLADRPRDRVPGEQDRPEISPT